MFIDMKTHTVAMVAVFVALGVGMLIGSALSEESYLMEQQYQMISRLEGDFQLLRNENQRLRERNQDLLLANRRQKRAIETLLPLSVRGLLKGTSVGLILADGVDPNPWERLITVAGGSVAWKAGAGEALGVVKKSQDTDAVLLVLSEGAASPKLLDLLEEGESHLVAALGKRTEEEAQRKLCQAILNQGGAVVSAGDSLLGKLSSLAALAGASGYFEPEEISPRVLSHLSTLLPDAAESQQLEEDE